MTLREHNGHWEKNTISTVHIYISVYYAVEESTVTV